MIENLIDFDKELLLFFNGNNSLFLDSFMWNYSRLVTWIPMVVALLYVIITNNKWKMSLCLILSLAVAFVLADQISSGLLKPLFHRFRPTHDPEIMDYVRLVNGYRGGMFGFVSSHAANSFAAVTFTALLFKNRGYSICIICWALINCYSRMYLGVHFPGDILGGILVGVISGYISFGLYKLLKKYVLKSVECVSYRNVVIVDYTFLLSILVLIIMAVFGFTY